MNTETDQRGSEIKIPARMYKPVDASDLSGLNLAREILELVEMSYRISGKREAAHAIRECITGLRLVDIEGMTVAQAFSFSVDSSQKGGAA